MKIRLILVWVCCLFSTVSTLLAQNPTSLTREMLPPFPEHLSVEEPQGKILGPGLFNHIPPVREIYNSATQSFAGHTIRGEIHLRKDGEEEIKIIKTPRAGWRWDIADALWSPDGKYLLAKQVDDREVPRIKLTKKDTVIPWPYSRAGEPLPKFQYYIINPTSGKTIQVAHKQDKPYIHLLSWSESGDEIRMARTGRLMKTLELLKVDPETGKVNVWFTESSDNYMIGLELLPGYTGRLRKSNYFYFLDERDQFIYMSERSGYYQLYLYDAEGKLVRPLTDFKSNGLVSRLVNVDPAGGWLYFIGQGDAQKPYTEQLYKASLDGNTIKKIVDGPYFPEVLLSKDRDSLWVWRNDMEKFSKLEVYNTSGEKLNTHWSADMSPITQFGFKPTFIQLKAADEKSLIEAMLLKPKDFNPEIKYPVVEWIYGAAHSHAIVRSILFPGNIQLQNLANAGFIVVIIDGRGTPGRGQKFRDYSYGKFGQLEMEDHVHALRTLASTRSFMDLERLGVSGHSWGGHYALRAVIEYPDFYKAAHLSAAAIDPAKFRVAIEPYMGCLPGDCPQAYKMSALTPQINKLKAPLLIHHGTADDDVPLDDSHQLVEDLKAIDYKNFEMLEFEGMDHIIMRNPAWEQGMIQFFEKELGASPK